MSKAAKQIEPEAPKMGTIENRTNHELVVFLGEKGRTREIIERGEVSKPLPVEDVRRFRASDTGRQGLDRAKETNNQEGIIFTIGTPPPPAKGSFEAMSDGDKIAFVQDVMDLDELADMRAKEVSPDVCDAIDARTQYLIKNPS